jgi:two-component system response regulator NreC
VALGHTNNDIARLMKVSTKTVETYRARIARKLSLKSRPDMVRYALANELI